MKKNKIAKINKITGPLSLTSDLCGVYSQPVKSLFLFSLTALILLTLIPGKVSASQARDQSLYSLKGTLELPDDGMIERKVRVPSFENVEGPVGSVRTLDGGAARGRNIFQGTGEVGNLKQIFMRESSAFTEINPVIFLRQQEKDGWTRSAIAVKESFLFDSIPPGEYQLTISVPGQTPVIQELTLSPDDAEEGVFNFTRSFQPSDPEEYRLLKNHYAPKEVPEGAKKEYNQGVKAIDNAQLDQALMFFTKAVSRAAHFTEAYERIGLIQLSRGDISEAETAFRQALDVDLYSYRSLANLGTILLNQGEVEEALKYYQIAVKVAPHIAQARYHLAMSLFQLGDMEGAASQLEKQKALDPNHFTQPQLLFAEIYRLNDDHQSMIRELEEFLRVFPGDPKCDQVRQALTVAREIQDENDKN